ncbi:hypothetical protein BJX70DRAFT_403131 [Aspergillus crustosus]
MLLGAIGGGFDTGKLIGELLAILIAAPTAATLYLTCLNSLAADIQGFDHSTTKTIDSTTLTTDSSLNSTPVSEERHKWLGIYDRFLEASVGAIAKGHLSAVIRLAKANEFRAPGALCQLQANVGSTNGIYRPLSYLDVVARLIELLIAQRLIERLSHGGGKVAYPKINLLTHCADAFLEAFANICPTASEESLNHEDVSFFLLQYKQAGRKPVSFIPPLDENFEFYFKTDSLWQDEDVEALQQNIPNLKVNQPGIFWTRQSKAAGRINSGTANVQLGQLPSDTRFLAFSIVQRKGL